MSKKKVHTLKKLSQDSPHCVKINCPGCLFKEECWLPCRVQLSKSFAIHNMNILVGIEQSFNFKKLKVHETKLYVHHFGLFFQSKLNTNKLLKAQEIHKLSSSQPDPKSEIIFLYCRTYINDFVCSSRVGDK